MPSGRIHCQILEVPNLDELSPRSEGSWPRDLLPWADPYIAALMLKLHKRRGETEGLLDDEFTLYQFAAEQWLGDDWRPDEGDEVQALDLSPRTDYPPIFGGFPLLDDLG